ncbi:hypothetical protein H5410_031435 [Solanum commersonii]|uniref:Uncharacterized protein n=1 Tax=Solanum commersonii TaxID=4109 RepID=A0A9J5YID8_SOLCO|nr:hypothetical protein H5410_031435 [Solanum commersonii]
MTEAFYLLANGLRAFSIARKKNPKTQGLCIGIPTPFLANGWIWFSLTIQDICKVLLQTQHRQNI